MAGKKQTFDNSEFVKIAGSFSKYSDLTGDAKNIVNDIITKCAGKKGYPHKKVYYVLFNCMKVNTDTIKYHLDCYYGTHKEQALPTTYTIRKFLTIIKQLSVALVEAHQNGVKLFKTAKEGQYYLSPSEKYTIDKAYCDGASGQELMTLIQQMIDDSAK